MAGNYLWRELVFELKTTPAITGLTKIPINDHNQTLYALIYNLLLYFCSMTRISTFFLLFTLIGSNMAVSQFCKLPALLQHYWYHQQGNRQMGFFEFLALHYGGQNRHDNDDERHRQLPFKDHTIAYSAYYRSPASKIQVILPPAPPVIIHYSIDESVHLQAHLNALFKPPQA